MPPCHQYYLYSFLIKIEMYWWVYLQGFAQKGIKEAQFCLDKPNKVS